jgi:hypothetical protein
MERLALKIVHAVGRACVAIGKEFMWFGGLCLGAKVTFDITDEGHVLDPDKDKDDE